MSANDSLRLMATYDNWTDREIGFGLLSTDEMMILFGYYYTDTGAAAGITTIL